MSIKGTVALALTIALGTSSVSPALAQAAQNSGSLAGRATDKAKKPYEDYAVRVHTVDNSVIIQTVPLNQMGVFSITSLGLEKAYLLDLVNTKDNNKIVCTEGPFLLNDKAMSKADINIDCGKNPTAWILLAGAGAAILAATTRSSKK